MDELRQTLIHLLKPISGDLEAIPDRGRRIKLRRMITELEEKKSSENPEMLATLVTSMLGEPSSPQSIQIPLKPEKDLYDTLLLWTKELISENQRSPLSPLSTTTTSTSSMDVHPPELHRAIRSTE